MKRIAFALVFLTVQAFAAEPPRMLVEIYHIAPGQHTAFLVAIAKYDEANRIAGLPPRQLYVHSDGASWDFLFIQPARLHPTRPLRSTPRGKSSAYRRGRISS